MGRSRGGLTTKIHALVDACGLPSLLKLTEGQANDGRSAQYMLGTVQCGDVLARLVEEGPDIAVHGVVRWRCVDLQAQIKARFDVDLSERQVGRILGQLKFTRLSVRPRHPQTDEAEQQAFKKTSQAW